MDYPLVMFLQTLPQLQNYPRGDIMIVNSKNMATMLNHFSSSSNVCDVFLLGKMDINNERKNKVKTSNLKMARDLSII
jgi:hypothetical protein